MPRSLADAVLVQAVIAGALSFAHLHDLAEAAGQSGWKGVDYPISVDLLMVSSRRGPSAADRSPGPVGLGLVRDRPGRLARRQHRHGRTPRPARRPGLAAHPRRWLARPRLPGRRPSSSTRRTRTPPPPQPSTQPVDNPAAPAVDVRREDAHPGSGSRAASREARRSCRARGDGSGRAGGPRPEDRGIPPCHDRCPRCRQTCSPPGSDYPARPPTRWSLNSNSPDQKGRFVPCVRTASTT